MMTYKVYIGYMLVIMIVVMGISSNSLAHELIGTVKTKSGEPIAGVYVVNNKHPEAPKTDIQGKFKLSNPERVLHFIHPEFRRLTKIIDASLSYVEVTLEAQADTDWILSFCPDPGKDKVEVWGGMYFTTLKEATYKQGVDTDFQLTLFWRRQNKKGSMIEIWAGPYAISPFPKDEWFTQAKGFAQRTWVCGKRRGDDFKGETPDGKYWRWTSVFWGAAFYENATSEEAAFFDKIIDSMCCGKK